MPRDLGSFAVRRHLLGALAGAAVVACAGCAQPGRGGRGAPDGEDRPDRPDRPERNAGARPSGPDGAAGAKGPTGAQGLQGAGHAYAPVQQVGYTLSRQHWPLDGAAPVAITLALPATPGPWPLVVYMPGLGETAESGAAWRHTWAAAGYAVLSAQVLDEDATAWRSDLAREGQFDQLARQHLGTEAMARRLAVWQALLAEARRRASAGEAPWARLDWQRCALAGYELGAASALQAARAGLAGLAPRALLLFSPYEGWMAEPRPAAPRPVAAVLAITGPADSDPLGLLPTPQARLALVERIATADRALLSLDGLPHGLLGGTLAPAAEAAAAVMDRDGQAGARGEGGGSRRRGGAGAPGGSGGEGGGRGSGAGRGGEAGGPAQGDGRASGIARSAGGSVDGQRLRRVVAQDVSTAWLDARVLDDAGAHDWLSRKAPGWVGGMGTLQLR